MTEPDLCPNEDAAALAEDHPDRLEGLAVHGRRYGRYHEHVTFKAHCCRHLYGKVETDSTPAPPTRRR